MTATGEEGIVGRHGTTIEIAGRDPAVFAAVSPVIQSVPAGHAYVATMRPPGVTLLADPPVPGAPASQWWPPRALDAAWIAEHAATFDLLHVHFGTEAFTPAQLVEAARTLRRAGRPLVYTVHDLEHPHLAGAEAFDPQLEALVAEADALITLTPGAAAELARRFGRTATVIPHPQVAPDAWFGAADALRAERATAAAGPVVGMHLRALRANVRPGAWLLPLVRATAGAGGAFHVFVNDEPLAADARRAWEELQRLLHAEPGVHLHRRPRPDDEALHRELAGLDLAVLPYRHGTHSGWAELCWDLGVSVAAPHVGFVREQHVDPWFISAPLTPATAHEVIADVVRREVPAAATRLAARRAQLAQAHQQVLGVYQQVLGDKAHGRGVADDRAGIAGQVSRGGTA